MAHKSQSEVEDSRWALGLCLAAEAQEAGYAHSDGVLLSTCTVDAAKWLGVGLNDGPFVTQGLLGGSSLTYSIEDADLGP